MSAAITVFIPKIRRSALLPKRRQAWTSAQLNAQIAQAGFPVVLEQDEIRRIAGHDQAIQLVFSYRPRQVAAAAVAAASLAVLTSGLVLDGPSWTWYSGEDALAWARDVFAKHGSEQPDRP